jgi:hypothetical protein
VASFGVDIGWCGFGWEGGLLPNVRLGVFRFWCCRGTIFARVAKLHTALAEAAAEIKELGRGGK